MGLGPLPKETAISQVLPQIISAHANTELSLNRWACHSVFVSPISSARISVAWLIINNRYLSLGGDVPWRVKVLEHC